MKSRMIVRPESAAYLYSYEPLWFIPVSRIFHQYFKNLLFPKMLSNANTKYFIQICTAGVSEFYQATLAST